MLDRSIQKGYIYCVHILGLRYRVSGMFDSPDFDFGKPLPFFSSRIVNFEFSRLPSRFLTKNNRLINILISFSFSYPYLKNDKCILP